MKVAIQGLRGAFHHEAATRLLEKTGEEFELVECPTFPEVFEAVRAGNADYGVAAVENNLFGSINPVYGLLEKHDLWIAGDVTLHINQYLIAHVPTTLEDLQKGPVEVLSQVMAIAQCDQWLTKNLPQAIRRETYDTAGSIDMLAENSKTMPSVAIAGKKAAEERGGHIVAGPINDDPNNYTRFFLLQKKHEDGEGAERTSIILRTDHSPGALYKALGAFEKQEVNLSKLDSHPIPGDKRHYAFYIDFEAPLSSAKVQGVLRDLEAQGCVVRVLGSYPVTK